jgi:tetratricopeptide (TPR) repeat protein
VAVLGLLAGVPAGSPAASDAPSAEPEGPAVEALIARGITHSAGTEMRRGLDELRAAARLSPGNELARRALAVGLLRSGRFAEAEGEFAAAVGEVLAGALTSGAVAPADMPDSIDREALLGLGAAVHYQGRAREAERLYRAYAVLVGPMSRDAGRAYYRLHELAAGEDVLWIDADAELAKALAVDPNVRTARLLPVFPDPGAHPELEPYLRPVELSESRADTALAYDALPLLSRWVAPADTSEALAAIAEGSLRLEILVTADGRPVDVVPLTEVAEDELPLIREAVSRWRFTPAEADGAAAPAWILFGGGEPEQAEPEQGEPGQEEPADDAWRPAESGEPGPDEPGGRPGSELLGSGSDD